MGQIAEALRNNLRSLAESDARSLQELDQELSALRTTHAASQPALPKRLTSKHCWAAEHFSSKPSPR